MATKISDKELKALVGEVLRERFQNVEIYSIDFARDVDEDGEAILRLRVVFDGERKTLDSFSASSVARYLLPRLSEAGEEAFPVISYIARSDLRESDAAARL